MGLFFNNDGPSDIFKNRKITETNQTYFKNDPITELVKEQLKLKEIVEKETSLKQIMLEQIQSQYDTSLEIKQQLKKNDSDHQEILLLLHEQMEQQKQFTAKFSQQEDFQNNVINRLDKQEALTEKLTRQLNHLRSVLYERTSFLAEKIEESYKLTATYIHNAINGANQPISFFLLNKKNEDKNK